uniref:Uncharacterized protein n=1 Tax=Octactis speculum TaxID=3111310 RepID=A0A7S2MFC9_9STRA|mmetsp:Transcript_61321/g.84222  ORF Transcript_61321/g.84222 Transcript_61321/m.84222 type:complete len:103 (+) Transcript_61321:630-938(+)
MMKETDEIMEGGAMAFKVVEVEESEEVVWEEKALEEKRDSLMEQSRYVLQKMEAHKAAEAFNAQLKKGEDNIDVLSEGLDMCVGVRSSSQGLPLLGKIVHSL